MIHIFPHFMTFLQPYYELKKYIISQTDTLVGLYLTVTPAVPPPISVGSCGLSFLLLNPLFHTIPSLSLHPSQADAMTFLAAA